MRKSLPLAFILLVSSILLVTCSRSSYASNVSIESDQQVFLPLVLNRYPYIPVFGIDASSNIPQIKDANLYWLRVNSQLRWSDVQPANPSQYDWQAVTGLNNYLIQASENGLEPILTIHSTPAWAQLNPPGKFCGPIAQNHFSSFANFMREVVRMYSQPKYNIRYYQIWNEPDATRELESGMPFGCWGDPNDPYYGGEYFAEMLKQVYPAMKSANPHAQVILGGLLLGCDPRGTGDGYCEHADAVRTAKFFEGVLRNSGGNNFDILAFHGYGFYFENKSAVWSERNHPLWRASGGVVDGKLSYLRSIMGQYGVDKPIFQTEAALLYEGSQQITYQQIKADYAVWLYARNWSEKLPATMWYTLLGWRGSELIDSNGQPLPVYDAIKNMTTILERAEFVSREKFSGYDRFIFNRGNQRVWLIIPTTENLDVHLSIPKPAGFTSAKDIYGSDLAVGDPILFSRPVYLFVNP